MQVFSVKTQLYYSTHQLHVSATPNSLHQVDPTNIKTKKYYSCNIGRRYRPLQMCYIKQLCIVHDMYSRKNYIMGFKMYDCKTLYTGIVVAVQCIHYIINKTQKYSNYNKTFE